MKHTAWNNSSVLIVKLGFENGDVSILTMLNSSAERLRSIRKLSRLSRSDIANKHGISANTLKHWETSSQPLSDNAINKCTEIYRNEGILFSRDWIIYGTGLAPKTFAETGKNFTSTLEAETITQNDDELLLLKEVNFFRELYQDSTVMIVPNNDMLPYYKSGDYVCGRRVLPNQLSRAINKDCIIQLINGDKYFRRLVRDNNGIYNITCLNPFDVIYEPVLYNVQIESAAPIIWHRKVLV